PPLCLSRESESPAPGNWHGRSQYEIERSYCLYAGGGPLSITAVLIASRRRIFVIGRRLSASHNEFSRSHNVRTGRTAVSLKPKDPPRLPVLMDADTLPEAAPVIQTSP